MENIIENLSKLVSLCDSSLTLEFTSSDGFRSENIMSYNTAITEAILANTKIKKLSLINIQFFPDETYISWKKALISMEKLKSFKFVNKKPHELKNWSHYYMETALKPIFDGLITRIKMHPFELKKLSIYNFELKDVSYMVGKIGNHLKANCKFVFNSKFSDENAGKFF